MLQDSRADFRTFETPDGGRLCYSMAGAGEPVVLIHGLGLDAAMWDPQWPALVREFRAIRYEVRGFGRSSVPNGPYSHSEDLLALLDFLKAQPAHVIGLSMGGGIALRFALDHPTAVRSLTVIDPALEGFRWSADWLSKMNTVIQAARTGDANEARRLWLAHELFAPARREARLAAELAAMVERYSTWHWQHDDPVRRSQGRAIDLLSSVSARTLVVMGELDMPDFTDIARRLAAQIPKVTLHTLTNVGHLSSMEAPDVVNGLLLAHLRGRSIENGRS